jgi:hypothetical protein
MHRSDLDAIRKCLWAPRSATSATVSCVQPNVQADPLRRGPCKFTRSGRALVDVMKAAEHGHRPYLGGRLRCDITRERRVALQALVAPRRVVIGDVLGEHREQVPLAEGNDVVRALSPDRSDHTLHVGVAPR